MARVFISYAHENFQDADEVRQLLIKAHHEPFLYQDRHVGIPPGEEWEQHLHRRLHAADAMVCVVTAAYQQSSWCAKEIATVRRRPGGCPILPLQAEPGVRHELLTDLYDLELTPDREESYRYLVSWVGRVGRWPDDRPRIDPVAEEGVITSGVELAEQFGRCHLPPGRHSEAADLKRWLNPDVHDGRTTVVITGDPATGKTTLARYVAWEARDLFHGRVVYVGMNGYAEPPQAPIPAEQVYSLLLRALGVEGWRGSPDSHDYNAAAVYRQQLTEWSEQGRFVLLVLDDVVSLDQIGDLLLPHCRAHRFMIISRDQEVLAELELETYRSLRLQILDVHEAITVLKQILPGDQRLLRESGKAEELASSCGLLPQALKLVGRLLAENPDMALDELSRRLAALDRDGVQPVERRAFQLSWDHLNEARGGKTVELLLLLSANPGQDISTKAAVALADQPEEEVWDQLEKLKRAHLIDYHSGTDRWQIHDRIREYVNAIAEAQGRARDLNSAFIRLFTYYQERATDLAEQAGWFLLRHSRPRPEQGLEPHWEVRKKALEDFERERLNLLDCLRHATEIVYDNPSSELGKRLGKRLVDLTRALAGYLRNDGPCSTAEQLHRRAADIAYRCGEACSQAIALNDLGITNRLRGNLDQANQTLQHAECIFGGLLDPRTRKLGQANVFNEMGIVANEMGKSTRKQCHHKYADRVLEKAWKLYSALDVNDKIGVANCAKNRGVARYWLGDPSGGDVWLLDALGQYTAIKDFLGVVEVHNHHGRLYLESGRFALARGRFYEALHIMVRENIHSLLEKARAHEGIGLCNEEENGLKEAIKSFEEAERNYSKIGADGDRKRLQKKLNDLRRKLNELAGQVEA